MQNLGLSPNEILSGLKLDQFLENTLLAPYLSDTRCDRTQAPYSPTQPWNDGEK